MSNLKKLKATPLANLKAKEKESEKFIPKKNFEKNRVDIIRLNKLEDKDHKFRIMPAHPGTESFAYMLSVHWLPALFEVKEEDKKNTKGGDKKKDTTKIDGKEYTKSRRTIFNSRVHGDTEKDIIEEYIRFAEKIIKDSGLKEEQVKEKLQFLYGGPFGSSIQGISAQTAWMMYVKHEGELKRLEVSDSNMKKINKVAHSESGDEPIAIDPFTDPVDGRYLIVSVDSKAKQQSDKYAFKVDSSFDKATKQMTFAPLTEKDVDEFLKLDSLESLYVNSYKKSDFEKALEGLRLFDEDQEIGAFEYEEFIQIAEEIAAYYPDEEAKEEGDKKPSKKSGDQFDQMERDELKAFIKKNKLAIMVTTKMDDNDIREFIREAMAEAELEADIEEVEEEFAEEVVETEDLPEDGPEDELPFDDKGNDKVKTIRNAVPKETPKPAAPAAGNSMKERMEAMKNKINSNKK